MTESKFARCTPEELGISSKGITAFIEAFESKTKGKDRMEMHSFMLLRHGKVAAEAWWSPYSPDYRHMLYSLSKSFTSTAVGFIVSEGLLSLDDKVISYFPEDMPAEISENLKAMTIKHLLTMSTGHAEDTLEPMWEQAEGNWVKAFLEMPVVYEPGTHFLYNTGATYMLSAIIQKVTGSRMLGYLKPRLFEPLNIKNPVWDVCPMGIDIGGYGLSIKTEDIARFGQLYLQKGKWEGRQLIPLEWVEEATRLQISNSDNPENGGDWEQGYGYQFWRCRHNSFRGDGAYGQYCIVIPEKDAVFAANCAVEDMGLMFDLVWDYLYTAMHDGVLPEDEAAYGAMCSKISSLKLPVPEGIQNKAAEYRVSGKKYKLDSNEFGIGSIQFDFNELDCCIEMTGHNTDGLVSDVGMPTCENKYSLKCGIDRWVEGRTEEAGIAAQFAYTDIIYNAGAWTDEKTFKIILRLVESPHYNIITCRFDDSRLEMDFKINLTMFTYDVKPLYGKGV